MNNFKTNLLELETILSDSNALVVNHFQIGKKNNEIEDAYKRIEISATENIFELYNWHNGVNGLFRVINQEIELFPVGIFMPLEYAISSYILETKTNKIFSKDFFPIFTNGAGDYIAIQINPKKDNYGQLYLYAPPVLMSSELISIYDSLDTLLLTIIELYKNKVYYFSNGKLEIDYEKESPISKKYNPQSAFWG